MGNRLCKKKSDVVDAAGPKERNPSAFDRIINKFSPKSKWKSDTNLEEKQVNSYQVNGKMETAKRPESLGIVSKSSDWTDVPLEVPEKVTPSYGKNNNVTDDTPIPPPRKKKTLRQTLGSLIPYKKPVEEQIMVQKKIDYRCPCCVDGFHRTNKVEKKVNGKQASSLKETKKRKTPSIASLPNYTDFKLTVAGETNVDKDDQDKHSSAHSLPDESKKPLKSNDKIDNYLTRARSFGSLLPTMLLHKMSTAKAPLAEIESDDSLGGLDDWGLNMIEHYKPRDSSLPRPRRPKTQEEMLAEIEKQLEIDANEEVENLPSKYDDSKIGSEGPKVTPRSGNSQMAIKLEDSKNAARIDDTKIAPKVTPRSGNTQLAPKFEDSKMAVRFDDPKIAPKFEGPKVTPRSAYFQMAPELEGSMIRCEDLKISPKFEDSKMISGFENSKIAPRFEAQVAASKLTPKSTEVIESTPPVMHPTEHSSLMKILEKYGDKQENGSDGERKHPVNDFLNAERAHLTGDFAKMGINNTIAT